MTFASEIMSESESEAMDPETGDRGTEEFHPVSPANIVMDYDEGDGGADSPGRNEEIEARVGAFAALEGLPENQGEASFSMPRATENFPFGAKERPARARADMAGIKGLMSLRSVKGLAGWLKATLHFSGKAVWVNAGPVAVFVLLVFSMIFVMAERPYVMLLDGKPIAFVRQKEDGQKLLEQVNLEMSAPYPAESNFRQYAVINYTRDGVKIKTKTTDSQVILETLKDEIAWFIDAWTISVSNERTVFLATKTQAEEVLESVKKSYLPESDELTILNAEFVEPVELIKEEIPVNVLGSPDQAFRTLTEGREPIREYQVQRGDSYWSIAQRNNMTVDELKLINGATSDRLSIGQILKLNIPKPLLSVKTTVSEIRYEDIPFDVVYRSNGNVWEGQSKVLHDGADGILEVEYEIARVNGVEVAQRVLSETVVVAPVDKVVENGARRIIASRSGAADTGGGMLAWPIRSMINSPFGERGEGFHNGVDIEADEGDPVYSAGAGIVISAGVFSGYGNQVTIDHGGGLSTMYAHLSEISVDVGQEVGALELIGLAGTTGRTTGAHLPYEVRINDSPVNPVNYTR
jgi:murein DD-endopeptidase MepM/ murein hydrolase activator NlpD